MTRWIVVGLLAASGVVSGDEKTLDQKAAQGKAKAEARTVAAAEQKVAAEKKKEWLRSEVIAKLDDPKVRKESDEKLDRLSPKEILALADYYEAVQQERERIEPHLQRARTQSERDALLRQAQSNLRSRQPGVTGFAPVVTWLPEGTSMNVGAVVSPDRRYVRINAAPLFSSIPQVDTFNFGGYPGYGYPSYGGYPGYGYPAIGYPIYGSPYPVYGHVQPYQPRWQTRQPQPQPQPQPPQRAARPQFPRPRGR